jgi:hypothetical protein
VHRDGDRATLEATLWDTAGEMTVIAQVVHSPAPRAP